MIPLFDRAGKRRLLPVMTLLLITMNVAIFTYEVSVSAKALGCLVHDYGVIPRYLAHLASQPSDPACPEYTTPMPLVLTTVTSLFLHAGWLHIAGNMLFLLIFGDNVEDRLGHIGFLLFYLLCGVVGVTVQALVTPNSPIPIVGASGAVAGVLGAYLILFPLARVRTLIFVVLVDLPAWLLIGLWVLIQALSGLAVLDATANTTGGVAYFAHLGGFAVGLIVALLFRWFAPPAPPPSKASSRS